MNNSNTPETDAASFEAVVGSYPDGSTATESVVDSDFARKLERERNEAREELENILNVIPADAPCLHAETGETVADYILDLQKEVGRVHALYFNDKQQLEAMREAIKEAHGAFDEIACGAACLPGYSIAEASTLAQTILAKLQPFLKP